MLSIAAPFNRDAAIPAGDVTVRDVAGLYVYDNTLLGIRFTGAQVLAYLEWSARYFKQVTGAGPYAPDDVTNAPTSTAPTGTPDYNYDVMAGLDAPLAYDIDLAQAPGSRIRNLTYGGAPGHRRPVVRHRDQQLPPVRRRRLPRGHHRAGALQRARWRSAS